MPVPRPAAPRAAGPQKSYPHNIIHFHDFSKKASESNPSKKEKTPSCARGA
jgi:hypothetical protein